MTSAVQGAIFRAACPHTAFPSRIPALALVALLSATMQAQTAGAPDRPADPVSPANMNASASGQKTVRAIKLSQPLKVDGVLDDEVYKREQPFDGMIQA